MLFRSKSKFGARLEPASYVDIQLYTGKTFDVVTQVEAIENFGDAISGDYQRWTIASAILETAERFTNNEGEPALQQFLLLTGALKSTILKQVVYILLKNYVIILILIILILH